MTCECTCLPCWAESQFFQSVPENLCIIAMTCPVCQRKSVTEWISCSSLEAVFGVIQIPSGLIEDMLTEIRIERQHGAQGKGVPRDLSGHPRNGWHGNIEECFLTPPLGGRRPDVFWRSVRRLSAAGVSTKEAVEFFEWRCANRFHWRWAGIHTESTGCGFVAGQEQASQQRE